MEITMSGAQLRTGKSAQDEVAESEERLQSAMLSSDVGTLDELLSRDLIFTNHLGHLASKDEDLAAHRSGLLKVAELTASGQRIVMLENVAIVSVRTKLSGTYGGQAANGDFRFTRVWARDVHGRWTVVAVHSSLVV